MTTTLTRTTPPEWDIVTAAQNGDRHAFGQIYTQHYATVYKFLLCRTTDRTLAEDFTSETFLRALRRIDTVTYRGRSIAAWLVTIARNVVLDHVKSSRYQREITVGDIPDADTQELGPEGIVVRNESLAGAAARTAEVTAQVRWCVQQLSPDYQRCVTLRFFHGKTSTEAASEMGRSLGSLKALQHRALRDLRKVWDQNR